MSTSSNKRRTSPEALKEKSEKRLKLASEIKLASDPVSSTEIQARSSQIQPNATTLISDSLPEQAKIKIKIKKRVKINKLPAPKPFPAVAASVSATGPRSSHTEGKNYICLTRKTSLGAYMRRCKNLVVNDRYIVSLLSCPKCGLIASCSRYKTLHLHAAGAAIPLLLQLTCAFPPIIPFSRDEIHTEISTGTVEVQDEIIPEDEEEDLAYRTRGKSTLYVIFRIGDGLSEQSNLKVTGHPKPSKSRSKPKKSTEGREILVYQEPEQEQEAIWPFTTIGPFFAPYLFTNLARIRIQADVIWAPRADYSTIANHILQMIE